MILPILVIIAAWVFEIPFPWQVTLTIFASFHLLIWLIAIGNSMKD